VCRSAKEEPSKLLKIVLFCEFDVVGYFKVFGPIFEIKSLSKLNLI
jgi:hypothetical protein